MQILPPTRASHSYVQKIKAPPERVFPLLCPVREADWVPDWDPVAVYSHGGYAELDCVFVTRTQEDEAVWMITRYEPEAGRVEMVKVTPGVTACQLRITLTASSQGGTDAEVTYTHTALGPRGEAFVAGFTEAYYHQFMTGWEKALNHYLETGELISAAD